MGHSTHFVSFSITKCVYGALNIFSFLSHLTLMAKNASVSRSNCILKDQSGPNLKKKEKSLQQKKNKKKNDGVSFLMLQNI